MSVSSELPKKCQECAKSVGPIIYDKCNFCQDLEFNEEILCNLNQSIQNPLNFKCRAFRPIFKLTTPSANKVSDLSHCATDNLQRKSIQELLKSDKIKYKKALALQRLQRDPDEVYMELKYHFAWNVIHRRSVFTSRNDFLDFAHHLFSGCSDLVGGFVSLLWLAPDHVHLYVISDGEKSVETIVQEIKRSSNDAIMGEFADIKDRFDAGNGLWDTAYFAETIG
jgi:REP element-mobilizing transposase RayT